MEALRIVEELDSRREMRKEKSFSLLSFIGNTPLIQIHKMARHLRDVKIFAKPEWLNPGGSVKDRAGLRIIEDGEGSGQLTREKVILDSTSGNTGIAYAMIAAIKGYQVKLVVPDNLSDERRKTLLFYGAKLIFTDPLCRIGWCSP